MQSRELSKGKRSAKDYIVYIAFAAVFIFFAIAIGDKGFLKVGNLMGIIRSSSMMTVLAVAMTFVIAAGEFDLSVGAIAALGAVVSALVLQSGASWVVAILAGLGSGAMIGVANGLLVAKLGIPSFIATVGMSMVVRGLAKWFSSSTSVIITNDTFLNIFGQANIGGTFSILIVWVIAALIIGYVFLKKMSYGRKVLATGANRIAAEFSGINTVKIKFLVLLIVDIVAAVSGMLYGGLMSTAKSTIGEGGLELDAIAAVILGGAALSGGKGSVIGTVVAALLIGIVNNGIVIMGMNVEQQYIVTGAIIIAAVAFGENNRRKV